jgi:FkbM family methyltransferase
LPHFFARLVALRPNDINLNLANSDREGPLDLVVDHTDPGLSTATRELADEYQRAGHTLETRRVSACRLDAAIGSHCPDQLVDFLKIDVEGHEREVLCGTDLTRWRPRVIVIEAGYRPERWESLLADCEYVLAGRDPVNRYYVRSEDAASAELLRCPANVGDHYVTFEDTRAREAWAEWEALGPVIRNLARMLAQLKNVSPRATAFAKKMVAKVIPRALRDGTPARPR